MSIEITEENPYGFAQILADQVALSQALVAFAEEHPDLPAAYIITSYAKPSQLDFQLTTFEAIELWRVAMGVDPEAVKADMIGESLFLEFTAPMGDVMFRAYAMGPVPAPAEQESPEAAGSSVAAA